MAQYANGGKMEPASAQPSRPCPIRPPSPRDPTAALCRLTLGYLLPHQIEIVEAVAALRIANAKDRRVAVVVRRLLDHRHRAATLILDHADVRRAARHVQVALIGPNVRGLLAAQIAIRHAAVLNADLELAVDVPAPVQRLTRTLRIVVAVDAVVDAVV